MGGFNQNKGEIGDTDEKDTSDFCLYWPSYTEETLMAVNTWMS